MKRILFVLAARISVVLAALLSYISYEFSALTELSVDLLALESGLAAVVFCITAAIFSILSDEERSSVLSFAKNRKVLREVSFG